MALNIRRTGLSEEEILGNQIIQLMEERGFFGKKSDSLRIDELYSIISEVGLRTLKEALKMKCSVAGCGGVAGYGGVNALHVLVIFSKKTFVEEITEKVGLEYLNMPSRVEGITALVYAMLKELSLFYGVKNIDRSQREEWVDEQLESFEKRTHDTCQITDMLLEKGANPNTLHNLTYGANVEGRLLRHYKNKLFKEYDWTISPLYIAAEKIKCLALVKNLLECGAEINEEIRPHYSEEALSLIERAKEELGIQEEENVDFLLGDEIFQYPFYSRIAMQTAMTTGSVMCFSGFLQV